MFVQYFSIVFKENQIESVQVLVFKKKRNSTHIYIQTTRKREKKTQTPSRKLFMKSIEKFSPNFLDRAYNHHEKVEVPNNTQYYDQLNNL